MIFKSKRYEDSTAASAAAIIKSVHPLLVLLKLKEPVNGDDDMMAMLSSIDVNTRLRVSVIDTDSIRNSFASIIHDIKHFIPSGRDHHKLGTPEM